MLLHFLFLKHPSVCTLPPSLPPSFSPSLLHFFHTRKLCILRQLNFIDIRCPFSRSFPFRTQICLSLFYLSTQTNNKHLHHEASLDREASASNCMVSAFFFFTHFSLLPHSLLTACVYVCSYLRKISLYSHGWNAAHYLDQDDLALEIIILSLPPTNTV